MSRIFGFEPGDSLISDESSLVDFAGVDDMTLRDIRRKIRTTYEVEISFHALRNLCWMSSL